MLTNWLKRKQQDDTSENGSTSAPKKSKPVTETEAQAEAAHDESETTGATSTSSPPALTTETELQDALDFSSLDTTEAILERFDLIGNALLLGFHLVVRCDDVETSFEILELEFYLQKDGCHEDPFTHGSEEQKICGRWYFHRAPLRSNNSHRSLTSLTAYRSGSRKGMDLTIGAPAATVSAVPGPSSVQPDDGANANTNKVPVQETLDTTKNPLALPPPPTSASSTSSSSVRGGALLRTLLRLPDKKLISGPSLLVDEILRLSKTSDIPRLVEDKWNKDTSAFLSSSTDHRPGASLFLRPRPKGRSSTIVYRSPRIGLDLSHPGTTPSPTHPRVIFLSRLYRYFTHPNLLTSNGRPQTFLGALHACLFSTPNLSEQGLDSIRVKKELMRISGLNEATVLRYIDHYKSGYEGEGDKLGEFVGVRGKGASSSPATYLKMMGTLEKLKLKAEVK